MGTPKMVPTILGNPHLVELTVQTLLSRGVSVRSSKFRGLGFRPPA